LDGYKTQTWQGQVEFLVRLANSVAVPVIVAIARQFLKTLDRLLEEKTSEEPAHSNAPLAQ